MTDADGPTLGDVVSPPAPDNLGGTPTPEDPNAVEVLKLNDARVLERRTFSPGVGKPQSYQERETFLREKRL